MSRDCRGKNSRLVRNVRMHSYFA